MVIIRADRDDEYIDNLEAEVEHFLEEVEQQIAFVTSYA
jgi:hypothetical protein